MLEAGCSALVEVTAPVCIFCARREAEKGCSVDAEKSLLVDALAKKP